MSKKSKNFDRNLDGQAVKLQITRNLVKGEQILYQTANNIAPFDPLHKAKTPHLRQDTSVDYSSDNITRSWNAVYAEIRYNTNKKNPQTTKWIEKAQIKKKSVLDRIAKEGVIK